MKKCPYCGWLAEDKAVTCPHCYAGFPVNAEEPKKETKPAKEPVKNDKESE